MFNRIINNKYQNYQEICNIISVNNRKIIIIKVKNLKILYNMIKVIIIMKISQTIVNLIKCHKLKMFLINNLIIKLINNIKDQYQKRYL